MCSFKTFNFYHQLRNKGNKQNPWKNTGKKSKPDKIDLKKIDTLSCWSNKKRHEQDNQWIYVKEITKDVWKYSKDLDNSKLLKK